MNIRKIVLFLLLTISSIQAGEGIIVVLEAPLFQRPDINSKIVQHFRKGNKIYVHDQELGKAPTDFDYEKYEQDVRQNQYYSTTEENKNGFYKTLDKNGSDAYLLRHHVKLIYQDSREQLTSITPFKKDPTDYRLKEPLPPEYPLYDPNHYRAGVLLGLGPQAQDPHEFSSSPTEESYSKNAGYKIYYMRNVLMDPYNRFYFGGMIAGYFATSNTVLKDKKEVKDLRQWTGIGPMMSYDFHRLEHWRVTGLGGIFLAKIQSKIAIKLTNGTGDERVYENYIVVPNLGLNLQRKDLLPGVDFIGGMELNVFPPHSEVSSSAQSKEVWGDTGESKINRALNGEFVFLLGIQSTY